MKILITDIKDIALIFQALALGTIGILAFGRWRKEAIYKRQAELAEQVIELFGKLPGIVEYVFDPLSSSAESDRPREENETPEETERRDSAWIRWQRVKNEAKTFYDIESFRYRFIFLFGNDTEEAFSLAWKLLGSLRGHAFEWYYSKVGYPLSVSQQEIIENYALLKEEEKSFSSWRIMPDQQSGIDAKR